eukprot:11249843-Ditylum_brightwellii.AAC.1
MALQLVKQYVGSLSPHTISAEFLIAPIKRGSATMATNSTAQHMWREPPKTGHLVFSLPKPPSTSPNIF